VRQIGHLPELYEDARSEEYNILDLFFSFRNFNYSSRSRPHTPISDLDLNTNYA